MANSTRLNVSASAAELLSSPITEKKSLKLRVILNSKSIPADKVSGVPFIVIGPTEDRSIVAVRLISNPIVRFPVLRISFSCAPSSTPLSNSLILNSVLSSPRAFSINDSRLSS